MNKTCIANIIHNIERHEIDREGTLVNIFNTNTWNISKALK